MTVATDMLAAYLAAETSIVSGVKEVRFLDRTVRYEDLEWIQKGRREWESRVASERAQAAGASALGSARFSVASFR